MTIRQRGWLLPPSALLLVSGVFVGRDINRFALPLCACILAFFSVLLLKGRFRFFACFLFAFVLGVAAGAYAFHPFVPDEGDYEVRGVISDEITIASFGQHRVYLSDVELNGRPFSSGAYWTFYNDTEWPGLLPGKEVSFRASLYEPRGAVNPGGYNFREFLLQRGVTVCLYGKENLNVSEPDAFSFQGSIASLRHRLSVSLRQTLGEETGGYASALLLGMRNQIPSEDRQAFSNLGIAHILSVSGFHVGVLIGALACFFKLLHVRQKLRMALYAIVLFAYAALCGMSQPVIRASLLFLLSMEGKILHRPRSGVHLLSGVLVIMTLVSPVQVTSASFQLTFCAVFGIYWFLPLIRRVRIHNKLLRTAFESSVITFSAQLGLLFPELFFFQRLPLLVYLVNIPATLVFSILICIFWIVMLLLPFSGLASLLSAPLSAFTAFLLRGVRSLGTLPGLTLWLPMPNLLSVVGILLILLGCCLFIRLRAIPRCTFVLLGITVLVISLFPAAHSSTEYIQFSAGNADAAVLRDQDQVYVIDTGENDGTISTYLRQQHLTPDAVILTHLHADHAGGLQSMLDDGIPLRLLYLPEGAETQAIHPDFIELLSSLRAAGTEIRYLSRGNRISLPSGTLTVLWPEKGKTRPRQDANQYSLVTLLNLKGTLLMHTGDLTGAYETYCTVPADILKAAHHGSPNSTSTAFLSAVSPEVILLPCRSETRLTDFRERAGAIPVFGTPECGAVTVTFEDTSYIITPFLSH